MSDFGGLLASDFGLKPQGKSAPMASSRSSRTSNNSLGGGASSIDDYDSIFGSSANNRKSQDVGSLDGFADVFGGPPKYTATSESRGGGGSGFNFDSMMYGGSSTDSGAAKSSSLPKYDTPVYDDDIFDGVPGLKSSTTVKYDDVFASVISPPKSSGFDDLLGSLSGSRSESKSSRVKGSERVEKGVDSFDDLLGGFGSSPRIHRQTSEASRSSKSTVDATRTTPKMMEEPFVVLESASPPEVSSPRLFTDPLEETSKFNVSGGTQFDVSSVKGRLVDDMDPLGGLGKSVPAFSSETSDRGKDRSFLRKGPSTSGRHTPDSKESIDRSSVRSPDNQSERKRPGSNYPEYPQTMFAPTVSNSFHDSVGQQTASPPSYVDPGHNVMNSQADMSPTSEDNMESSDDVWLTVSEIPLFTQPTSAPPPSRPPPPRPAKVSKAEMGSFASRSARKTANDFSSVPNSSQYFESSKSVPAARGPVVSQIDQLEEFAMGRTRTNINEHVDVFSGHEVETNSDAAASAAAMKDAMDRAEAKFRHAKEVRERENAKAARSREAVQLEKDEKATEDRTPREKREEELREERRIEEERARTREFEREREEKEREQRKLEKERERAREIEREREKARQAVERATREARERAYVDAHQKAEKSAVEKVNAEARQRSERAAVQRAQAEARERAAADAKERAEKIAAEARERTNAEAKEKAARAELDARSRTERAAVERASAEARQRAAAEARDRAAAAATAKVNQQKNEDDLESFFGMGARPSSVPKARANSSDPLFDTQFQTRTGPEVARRTSVGTSSSMRKASSTTNIADDLSSIFGAVPSSGDFQEMEGETEERRRARLERHQRTQERAAKALADKNQRDLQVQRDQAERNRIGETLDAEIKRWSAGKEGNLRALLSTLQYVLWPECGWQPVSLTDLINAASVKKVYRKATLCIHPDKVQQKGANLQQKYVAEKVFDLLKEAWNKFNSEELF